MINRGFTRDDKLGIHTALCSTDCLMIFIQRVHIRMIKNQFREVRFRLNNNNNYNNNKNNNNT